jgi:transposase-like protein
VAKGVYKEWLTEDKLATVERWKRHGLANKQIADNIGISEETFYQWVKKYAEFAEAIKKGKEVIVCELENALIKRAKGYEVTESNSFYDRDGNEIKRETIRHVPPDTTALIFALKNMDAENWRDRKETALSGSVQTVPDKLTFVCAEDNDDENGKD